MFDYHQQDPELAKWAPIDSFVADVTARYPKDTKLLIGCRAGARSGLACKRLADAGFTTLFNVESGNYLRTRSSNEEF